MENYAIRTATDADYAWNTNLFLTSAKIAETAERETTPEMLEELGHLSGVLARLLHEAPSLRE